MRSIEGEAQAAPMQALARLLILRDEILTSRWQEFRDEVTVLLSDIP